MAVLFRVDAGADIGLGHLMRCLALAQALNKIDCRSVFLVNQSAVPICRQRQDWCAELEVLPNELTQQQEIDLIKRLIVQYELKAVVLDGYSFNSDYRQCLADVGLFTVCFDDTNSLPNLPCDLVINGAANADELDYKQSAGKATLCVGDSYRVLRQEFSDLKTIPIEQRSGLTLTMGGSDPLGLTTPILDLLVQLEFTDQVRVITGDAYQSLDQLEQLIQKLPLNISHLHNCQRMAEVFSHSRLVVSAAGGSQFELQACGAPSILLVIADNQRNASQQAALQGWCKVLNLLANNSIADVSSEIANLWPDTSRLGKMSAVAYRLSDTQGAMRVAQKIRQGCGV